MMTRDGHALTKKFLLDLRDPGITLPLVAELYASLRLQNSPPHWPTVNEAIREHFSDRSLTRIKNMADKIVERCKSDPRSLADHMKFGCHDPNCRWHK